MKTNMVPNKSICLTDHELPEDLDKWWHIVSGAGWQLWHLFPHKKCARPEQKNSVRRARMDPCAEAGRQSLGSEESRWLCL